MTQSKLESFLETAATVAIGFLVSMAVWQWIAAPLYDIEVTVSQNLGITTIFTLSSFIRSYFVRRFFAVGLKQRIHQIVAKFS